MGLRAIDGALGAPDVLAGNGFRLGLIFELGTRGRSGHRGDEERRHGGGRHQEVAVAMKPWCATSRHSDSFPGRVPYATTVATLKSAFGRRFFAYPRPFELLSTRR